jgi:hypothetical protein
MCGDRRQCCAIEGNRLEWRRGRDSNPRYRSRYTPLAGERLRPLGHLSVALQIAAFGRARQETGRSFWQNSARAPHACAVPRQRRADRAVGRISDARCAMRDARSCGQPRVGRKSTEHRFQHEVHSGADGRGPRPSFVEARCPPVEQGLDVLVSQITFLSACASCVDTRGPRQCVPGGDGVNHAAARKAETRRATAVASDTVPRRSSVPASRCTRPLAMPSYMPSRAVATSAGTPAAARTAAR